MPKNLKKQKRKAERQARRQLNKQQVAHQPDAERISPAVVANPSSVDPLFHFDGLNYQLIFAQYNHKECELARLNKTTARALVNKLNEITRVNNRSIASTHLLRDKIKGVGDYAALYDGLQEEIELYEIKYAHTGRIICYFKDEYRHNSNQETDSDITSNYCCIIAILEQHKKTRKR